MNFSPIYIQPFTNDSNSRNNQSQGFKNSWMDMRGCVWMRESFLRNDKWQHKIIEWIFSNLYSTFYILYMNDVIELVCLENADGNNDPYCFPVLICLDINIWVAKSSQTLKTIEKVNLYNYIYLLDELMK